MANNRIQIKRTSVTGRAANTSTLTNPGELALNMTDGIMYSTNGSVVFEVGANVTSQRITNSLTLDNDKPLRFKTTNTSAVSYFVQQNDDNFVFYTTNTSYGARPIWSIYANSDTSALGIGAPVSFTGANVNLGTTRLYANGSSGSSGQVLTSNGTATYWSTVSGGGGGGSVDVNAQYVWTNTHTFQANVAFTGNNISVVSNTGSVMFGGASDTNWRIGRSTGSTTKFYYTNNTLDIIAADSNLEGVAIGKPSGNTYLETGYAGTFTRNPIYVGNGSVNVSINSTSFSGTANNSVYLGGIGGGSYLRSDVDDQFSGAVLQVYNDTGVLGSTTGAANTLQIFQANVNADAFQTFHISGDTAVHFGLDGTTNDLFVGGWSFGANKYKVWHQNNDGASSGLDADLLDGSHASAFQTTAGLSANVATLAANAATYLNGKTEGNLNVNNALTANNSSYLNSKTESNLNVNNALTANNSSYLGSTAAASYVQNTDSRTLSGNLTFTANVSLNGLIANGTIGTAGQVLHSDGAKVYWSTDDNSGGTVTSVSSGNGLTGGPITTTGTLSVQAGTDGGLVSNSTGVFVTQGTGTVVNATGVHVNSSYIGTLTANNTSFVGSVSAANVVSNAQLSSNLANYQTTAGLSANVATLTANLATYIVANNGVISNSSGVFVNQGSGVSVNSTGVHVQANNGIVSNSTGTFAKAANGVSVDSSGINVLAGNTQLISNSTGVWANQANFDHNSLSNYDANKHIDHTSVSITAGSGLTGGGTIAASRTIDVGAGNGISVAADTVYVNGGSTLTVNTLGAHVNSTLSITTLTTTGNATIGGNLTINGNVTVIGANNLSIVDNMIYLNSNSTTSNVDLGFAGNYNDGTYKHAGFFRDASDGYWKPFDGYTPEPDAAVDIDTSNNTFNIAGMWFGNTRIGNTTVYATVNSTVYSGTANNSTNFGGYTWAAPGLLGSSTANGASFTYANVTGQVNTATFYATTSANVGANVQLTTSVVSVGNSTVNIQHTATTLLAQTNTTVNASMTASLIRIANSTGGANVTPTTIVVGNSTVQTSVTIATASFGGNVGINTTNTTAYTLNVNGSFAATTKSFVINHPTKSDMKLRYGSLEGPENGVYVRGKIEGKSIIELPEYWWNLIDQDTITVNLTPYGRSQDIWVQSTCAHFIHLNQQADCFFTVFAERKDVHKLIVEF